MIPIRILQPFGGARICSELESSSGHTGGDVDDILCKIDDNGKLHVLDLSGKSVPIASCTFHQLILIDCKNFDGQFYLLTDKWLIFRLLISSSIAGLGLNLQMDVIHMPKDYYGINAGVSTNIRKSDTQVIRPNAFAVIDLCTFVVVSVLASQTVRAAAETTRTDTKLTFIQTSSSNQSESIIESCECTDIIVVKVSKYILFERSGVVRLIYLQDSVNGTANGSQSRIVIYQFHLNKDIRASYLPQTVYGHFFRDQNKKRLILLSKQGYLVVIDPHPIDHTQFGVLVQVLQLDLLNPILPKHCCLLRHGRHSSSQDDNRNRHTCTVYTLTETALCKIDFVQE